MASPVGKVLSVNIGSVREFEYSGRSARSAIWKSPAVGRIAARGVNLAGDDQADRQAHGGPDKALYAYAVEDVRWWEQEIGRALAYGEFGENLTTEGIDVNAALVGERWRIGTMVLEVSEPRIPCWRLGVRMNDKLFPRRFTEALRPGPYFRILVEGDVVDFPKGQWHSTRRLDLAEVVRRGFVVSLSYIAAAQEQEQEDRSEERGAVTHREVPPRETEPAPATVTIVGHPKSPHRLSGILYYTKLFAIYKPTLPPGSRPFKRP